MIATRRLVLRDFEPADAEALRLYQKEPLYLEHYPQPPDADAIVRQATTWASEAPRRCYQLAIVRGEDGPVIGTAGVRLTDAMARIAEAGAELAPEVWGKGYAEEALATLIDFASRELGLRRVEAKTSSHNLRAHRLITRLGFARQPSAIGSSEAWFARELG